MKRALSRRSDRNRADIRCVFELSDRSRSPLGIAEFTHTMVLVPCPVDYLDRRPLL
jgi:hypothetical protein